MYCPKCGKEINEGVKFCPFCGSSLRKSSRVTTGTTTSGLAIASLILGIIPVIPIIGSILAITFGVKARNKIKLYSDLGGEGIAIAGIILGTIYLLASLLIIITGVIPALGRAKEQARRAVCISNLKQIGLGLLMFAVDHEGKFPDNLSEIYPKYISTPKTFICPSRKVSEKEVKKNFNACYDYVSGMTEKYPEDCILVYDKEENHKGEGRNVCFVSGSVKWIPREEWAKIYQQHQDSIEAYKIEEERYNEINKIIAEQNRILLEEYRRLHPNYFPSAP